MKAQTKTSRKFTAYRSATKNADLDILERDTLNEPQEENNSADFIANKWVRFFDRYNQFYYDLDQTIKNSPTISRIIQNKTLMCLGGGFDVKRSEDIPVLSFFRKMAVRIMGDSGAREINEIIASVNMANESLEEVIYKFFYDLIAFGNAFVEIIKTTKEGQPVVYLNHIPVEQVGIEKKNKFGVSANIAVSKYWVKGRVPKENELNENMKVIPMYPSLSSHTIEGTEVVHERSAIHVKEYCPGFEYWGLPAYIAARFWCNLEYRIPKYNINKFKNGFLPSAIIQFFGSYSDDEGRELIENLVRTFTDTDNGSKVFATAGSDERDKVNVQTIEDNSEGNYLELSRLAAQQIVTAAGWTMALAGHATAGQLGTNQQLRDEIEFITNMCIKPLQRVGLTKVINIFLKEVRQHTNNSAINNLYLAFANMQPISSASQIDPNDNLTMNEKRSVLGYDPITEEQLQQENNIQNALTTNTNPK